MKRRLAVILVGAAVCCSGAAIGSSLLSGRTPSVEVQSESVAAEDMACATSGGCVVSEGVPENAFVLIDGSRMARLHVGSAEPMGVSCFGSKCWGYSMAIGTDVWSFYRIGKGRAILVKGGMAAWPRPSGRIACGPRSCLVVAAGSAGLLSVAEASGAASPLDVLARYRFAGASDVWCGRSYCAVVGHYYAGSDAEVHESPLFSVLSPAGKVAWSYSSPQTWGYLSRVSCFDGRRVSCVAAGLDWRGDAVVLAVSGTKVHWYRLPGEGETTALYCGAGHLCFLARLNPTGGSSVMRITLPRMSAGLVAMLKGEGVVRGLECLPSRGSCEALFKREPSGRDEVVAFRADSRGPDRTLQALAYLPEPRASDRLRLVVVGDSDALEMGLDSAGLSRAYGLRVEVDGLIGCGIMGRADRLILGAPLGGGLKYCDTWAQQLRSFAASQRPQACLLEVGRWEVADVAGAPPGLVHIGEPAFDARLVSDIREAVHALQGVCPRLALATSPYFFEGFKPGGGYWPEDEPERVDRFNALIEQVASEMKGSGVSVFPLGSILSPGHAFRWAVGGYLVRDQDGVHFAPGVWFAVANGLLASVGLAS